MYIFINFMKGHVGCWKLLHCFSTEKKNSNKTVVPAEQGGDEFPGSCASCPHPLCITCFNQGKVSFSSTADSFPSSSWFWGTQWQEEKKDIWVYNVKSFCPPFFPVSEEFLFFVVFYGLSTIIWKVYWFRIKCDWYFFQSALRSWCQVPSALWSP